LHRSGRICQDRTQRQRLDEKPMETTMPADLAAWRKAQRTALLARRESVPADTRAQWNAVVTRILLDGFPALAQCVIGFCWPYRGEVDTRHFVYQMRKRGARAALPAVVAKHAPLEFRAWWPGVPMRPGVFDLPVPQSEVVHPHALLIPPVGFGARGYRLGYGGGYFDRTLAAMRPQPLKIGVAYEISRMSTIYPQPHDVPMDFIVTELGAYVVTPDGLHALRDMEQLRAQVAALLTERSAAGG
jgi:5-formyltetrahydrofolate cyclo-ligase